MAMIQCPECGKEISDKALTCPNCGVPINMEMPVKVTFATPSSFKVAPKLEIYVDNEYQGALRKAESLDVEVYPGRHLIVLNQLSLQSVSYEFDLNIPSDANEVYCEVSTGGLGPKCKNIIVK